ncbi:hypothetical protein GE21DRAFT_607 [Neurospora crassa]|uniref:BZIP domain-containing protein n=1 Tax=Neurospora crassa (strain ATCC 24698 / 74-OR23-1A / CBS 708.71 / DSM 1257 / FGSC 987) TaxID=367110 RepID=Q7SD17_NEUCR|nr:hypothetical protein NCU01851 [Neurospora crassa OR74A]EAA34649.1 hypothetical protein NCU01851 [Neurospora crassa OR74A]KHE81477.1 hypothetical protein GE21DRAFT_607 [Neurospora crassa]|eukprot:XP_963885.1 hypothetical protein NCU01851 [Neurospora crassa OR74A]
MPWKHKTAETRQRVRENQRRSRARREELMRDLQRRLDEQERLGVQATFEMQQAARQVAHENRRLRALLFQKGVSDAEVDEFLGRGDPGLIDNQQVHDRLVPNAERPKTPARSCNLNSSCENPPHRTEENSGLLESIGPPDEDDTPTVLEDWPHSSETSSSHLTDPAVLYNSGMETSCDVAAAILANMHGHADTSRIRVVLGCTGPSDCIVKNTRVFDLLDEAA